MNESSGGILPAAPEPMPAPFKDRSVGLIIFGILTILLGCLAGIFCLWSTVMLSAMAGKADAAQPPAGSVLPGLLVYGGLAAVLICLGVGSLMMKRWARALLLIFSWSWLLLGVAMLVVMICFVPKFLAMTAAAVPAGQPAPPPGAMMAVVVVMFGFLGVLFLVLPAVWTFFYSSRHVKATCESRDPVPGWTDACPLPVLAVALLLAMTVPMMLAMPLMGHAVFPFFGMFLTGFPGLAMYLVLMVIWAAAAWWIYRLESRGWWLILIALALFTASGVVTYAQHDPMDLYRMMGYTEAQIEPIRKSGLMTGNILTWASVLSSAPILIYLLCIKRYFRRG